MGEKKHRPTLTESALRRAIASGETSTVELKKAAPRPGELAERMGGMANAQGGVIIIGVEDSSLRVIGVPDARMALTRDMVLRAARQIDPSLSLDQASPEVYVLDGKRVVAATILPSRGPVYQASGVFWIRRGTHTVPRSRLGDAGTGKRPGTPGLGAPTCQRCHDEGYRPGACRCLCTPAFDTQPKLPPI